MVVTDTRKCHRSTYRSTGSDPFFSLTEAFRDD